jgi:hypothetical protein
MKEVDMVSLISTTYGFLLGEELLHLQLCRSSDDIGSKGTYKLYPGPVFDTVKVHSNSTDMGEWTTTYPITVLHMHLHPGDFRAGNNWMRPAPHIGEAVPVSIRTYRHNTRGEHRNGSSIEKVYTPMIIPQLLHQGAGTATSQQEGEGEDEDEDYTKMSMLVEAVLPNNRKLYRCMGDLLVGTIYYSVYLEKPTLYECIAQIDSEYLLLVLNEEDVVMKLAGVYYCE